MDWKLNVLIVIGSLGLIASTIASLEKISQFVKMVVNKMLKKRYIAKDTWPLKIDLKTAVLGGGHMTPDLSVEFIVEPRKRVEVDECKLIDLKTGSKSDHRCSTEGHPVREWKLGETLTDRKRFPLTFYGFGMNEGDKVQIEIEAEGFWCKSNVVKITRNL